MSLNTVRLFDLLSALYIGPKRLLPSLILIHWLHYRSWADRHILYDKRNPYEGSKAIASLPEQKKTKVVYT